MKTTKKQYNLFRKECHRWIKELNGLNWRTEYEHKEIQGARASFNIAYEFEDKCIDIRLSKDWGEQDIITNFKVKVSAFHEVVEGIFLHRLSDLAKMRYIQEREVWEEVHSITRTLENFMVNKGLIK